ncbi:MAG: hypothetical protein AAF723_05180, partial [Pseudomonadota bacterium]
QHVDYGFNDWYAVRLVMEQDDRQGQDFTYRSFTFENRFQVFEKNKHGWDGGFRINYIGGDDGVDDELDIRLISNVPLSDKWAFRNNIILEHRFGGGADDGMLLELRTQFMRDVPFGEDIFKNFSVGVEMFNDFGNLRSTTNKSDQDHQFGPVAKASFDNGAYLQAGYRAGLYEEAPDHLFKFFVGQKF